MFADVFGFKGFFVFIYFFNFKFFSFLLYRSRKSKKIIPFRVRVVAGAVVNYY